MSVISATHMKYVSLGRIKNPRCNTDSKNNVLATTTRNRSHACTAPALVDQRQCICPFMQSFWSFGFGHFYYERVRGESEIPATALDVFTVKADPSMG